MSEYLFVYGTLRKDYDLKLKTRVKDGLRYVGQAKIGAALYDIGKYPGAVKDRNGGEVVGDVFEVKGGAGVFKVLDEYEGYKASRLDSSEFVRKKGKVKMRNGREMNAWIYWYNFDPSGKTPIRYKNYLNYLKNKSIH